MAINDSTPMRFTPRGLADAYDSTDTFPGACQILQNLVFDQANPELVVCRPGVLTMAAFQSSFNAPGFISVQVSIGTRVFGMISSGRNALHDEPFIYDTATGSFVALTGVTSGNTPVSPAITGQWTPPTISNVGVYVIVTHPGFPGGGTKFGWFDMTTPTAPVWHGGDTATNGLAGIPVACANYNNRAWFAVGNQVEYTDDLLLTRTNATQALVVGDNANVTALSGLPLQTTSEGIIATLSVFKETQVWQVTGDTTTSNLALNFVSLNVGCNAPRTLSQSPLGLYFMSVAGPYVVDQLGTLRPLTNSSDQLNPDVQVPLQNAIYPSRWCGAYTSHIWRLCGPTVVRGVKQIQDYWFDEHKRRWNGPHTFQYDCASALGGSFILSSVNSPGTLLINKPFPTNSTTYLDQDSTISFMMQTATFPKTSDMLTKQVAEAQIELGTSGQTVLYDIQAQDEQGNVLDEVGINVSTAGPPWGSFDWDDGTLWSANKLWGGGALWGNQTGQGGSGGIWSPSTQIPHTYPVNWSVPLVFEKLQLQVLGEASGAISIGTFFARYQKTGYMTTGAYRL